MNALTFASAYRQLTPTEKLFVDGYVEQLQRVYDRKGERISNALYRPVDQETVNQSNGMLVKPMVLAAITERITQLAQDSELTNQRIIRELMHIGFASVADYFETDPITGLPTFNLNNCTPSQLAALKKIKVKDTLQGREYEVELHPKIDALDRLAKYSGLYEMDNAEWRSYNARPAKDTIIDNRATVDQAANIYAQLIEAD